MEYKIKLDNEKETIDFGQTIGQYLKEKDVIVLEGELGAGKTTLTKGIGKALKINKIINSPTFTIMKTYSGNLPLYHFDVYRLEGQEEDLGFEEYFYGDGVSVIEWAKFINTIPEEHLEIILKHDNNKRIAYITPKGERYIEICEKVFE